MLSGYINCDIITSRPDVSYKSFEKPIHHGSLSTVAMPTGSLQIVGDEING